MPDALKVELQLLGVDSTLRDLKRVAREMQQLERNGGGGGAAQRQQDRQQRVQRQETQQARAWPKLTIFCVN